LGWRVIGVPAERVMVVSTSSPAHYAVEGGWVLSEPGQLQAWIDGSG
jgi:hypothetical protein